MFSKLTRVSPAMGVAIVALVLSLGRDVVRPGRGDQARQAHQRIQDQARLDSRRPPRQGRRDRRPDQGNSITGKQINEKTLGTVPSATRAQARHARRSRDNAQRATNADNALALGGTAAAGYLSFASRGDPVGHDGDRRVRHREQRHRHGDRHVVDPEDPTP